MTLDIKRTVDKLDRVYVNSNITFILEAFQEWPHIYFELHRQWAMEQERDELREAILKLGYLTGTEGYCGDHVVLTVRLNPQEANAWNTIIAKLRAEVKP